MARVSSLIEKTNITQDPQDRTLGGLHSPHSVFGKGFFAKVVIEKINTYGRQQNGAHDKHGGSDF